MNNRIEKLAVEKGYTITKEGKVLNKNNKLRNLDISNKGYYRFTIKKENKCRSVLAHRLQAFIKFGDKIYDENIEVRHLNGVKEDNSFDNIEIGTHTENMNDIPKDIIIKKALHASTHNRKFTDNEMIQIREYYQNTKSYKKTKEKFNISSSGTLQYILHINYVTKKE